MRDRASGIKNIKNANEWELEKLALQYFCNLTVPFPLPRPKSYLHLQLSGIRSKFWEGRKEGRGKGGNRGCGDKKVGSFERVRFDSAVKRESMRGRNCSETETTVDETRSFERCNCKKKRVNNDF